MTIFDILEQQTGFPVVYSHFKKGTEPKQPPYFAYIGAGQNNFEADNTYYHSRNLIQLEYYFTEKRITTEAQIEKILLDNGYLYDKSEDIYLEDQGVFVIYYQI